MKVSAFIDLYFRYLWEIVENLKSNVNSESEFIGWVPQSHGIHLVGFYVTEPYIYKSSEHNFSKNVGATSQF